MGSWPATTSAQQRLSVSFSGEVLHKKSEPLDQNIAIMIIGNNVLVGVNNNAQRGLQFPKSGGSHETELNHGGGQFTILSGVLTPRAPSTGFVESYDIQMAIRYKMATNSDNITRLQFVLSNGARACRVDVLAYSIQSFRPATPVRILKPYNSACAKE